MQVGAKNGNAFVDLAAPLAGKVRPGGSAFPS